VKYDDSINSSLKKKLKDWEDMSMKEIQTGIIKALLDKYGKRKSSILTVSFVAPGNQELLVPPIPSGKVNVISSNFFSRVSFFFSQHCGAHGVYPDCLSDRI